MDKTFESFVCMSFIMMMFVFVPIKRYVFPFSFALFHNVRVPRENLLNKTGDVAPDGRYVSLFKVRTILRLDYRK